MSAIRVFLMFKMYWNIVGFMNVAAVYANAVYGFFVGFFFFFVCGSLTRWCSSVILGS